MSDNQSHVIEGYLQKIKPEKAQPDVRNNADLIVDYLKQIGVEYVFGIPGGAIEPLYNALAKASDGPKAIIARHETGAAFMAEGYARETGKIGVCCATTGPGTTNLITGISSAYVHNFPILVITAQTALPKFGKFALQESSCTGLDILGMLKHCTRYNTLVSHPEQIHQKIISAIMAAQRQPSGPVHLSFPPDVLIQPALQTPDINLETLKPHKTLCTKEKLQQCIRLINQSSGLILYLGQDCRDAVPAILLFAEITKAAIITSPEGKRWISALHPQYFGVIGYAGHSSAKHILDDNRSDCVIAIGTNFSQISTGDWIEKLSGKTLVHIDNNAEHFTRSQQANLHIYGSLDLILEQLNQQLKLTVSPENPYLNDQDNSFQDDQASSMQTPPYHSEAITLIEPEKCIANDIPIKPQRVAYTLSKNLPSNYQVHIDSGNVWAWFIQYFHPQTANANYHIALDFGSMSWAIGTSIGTAFASNKPTLCVTGDGSYLMAGQEITVALQHRLPVVFLIFNDSELGMVKQGQKLRNAEPIGFELPSIDFAAMARSMGIEGITITSPQEFENIDWTRLADKKAPTLIDLLIDENEVPPMKARIKDLTDTDEVATTGATTGATASTN